MPEQIGLNSSFVSAPEADAAIAGKSLRFYWRAARFFLLLLAVLYILNVVFDIYAYGHWVIEAVVFFLFNYWLIKKWRVGLFTALAGSLFLGLVAGLVLAFFDIFWYHKLWYLLNLIRQPFLASVMGLIIGTITFFLVTLISIKKVEGTKLDSGSYGKESGYKKY